ncbi:lysozyme inhibitor LprI family protein [uncultured Desulfovibrio sp.]|uniref:lysozyme inhibitor LprI family protein n=1 Tax=uncultured Desulfovibrio sp. TaxID=167968 RepID=UPI002637A0AC|nr:lysozyme inhibitor LprI family protein [uncultured Desulfovibrio sp.]
MSPRSLSLALLAALLLAVPAVAAEHAPGFEACMKKHRNSGDQKPCLDLERAYWQKKLDTRYQAAQGLCKKFSGPEAEKRSAACLAALEESQYSWLAYTASMRPLAENHPDSKRVVDRLGWFEIEQLRRRIHDLEQFDPSLDKKPPRQPGTMENIERGLSDFGNSVESLFNSGMKSMGLD